MVQHLTFAPSAPWSIIVIMRSRALQEPTSDRVYSSCPHGTISVFANTYPDITVQHSNNHTNNSYPTHTMHAYHSHPNHSFTHTSHHSPSRYGNPLTAASYLHLNPDVQLLDELEMKLKVAHLKVDASKEKYLATYNAFTDWCEQNQLPMDSTSVNRWMVFLAVGKKNKDTTIDQKLSHLQFVVELGLLDSARQRHQRKILSGLHNVMQYTIKDKLFLPSMSLSLLRMTTTNKFQDAVLLQSLVGLRGGQMLLLSPNKLLNYRMHVVPPYKKCLQQTVLPLNHVPPVVIDRFLRWATSPTSPILNVAKKQYQQEFSKICLSLGYKFTSQYARHCFASCQHVLGVPTITVGEHLCHADPRRTTKTYIHTMPDQEITLILNHPELFQPALPRLCISHVRSSQLLGPPAPFIME